ncbi:MAG: ATP synthase F1 subunit gamma [Chloroflexi bacterium]|nr:ATP synthase F1 subunit gamma [Chloroflexota bacterium]
MPSVRQIKRRIRSVENTAKITKAMSMIAASKMRRVQETALAGRPYSEHILGLLADLAAQTIEEEETHPLLRRREEVKNVSLLLITPDRGLTGGLNANINRAAAQFIVEQDAHVTVIAVGRKGRDFMVRAGQDVKAVFTELGDRPTFTDITPISHLVAEGYSSEEADAVYIAFARYVNPTVQTPVVEPLLPVVPTELAPGQAVGYIFEPDGLTVLSQLLPRFVDMELYHAILESIASEQSARMVAMRNATDSANEMAGDLTLEMNKVRQESITNELLDIVGGAAAVQA